MSERYDYLLLKADGSQECLHRTDRPLSLGELQGHVGGYIEFAPLSVDEDPEEVLELCVNEEGLLITLPLNERASRLAGQVIVGDVVLSTRKTFESTGITDTEEG